MYKVETSGIGRLLSSYHDTLEFMRSRRFPVPVNSSSYCKEDSLCEGSFLFVAGVYLLSTRIGVNILM